MENAIRKALDVTLASFVRIATCGDYATNLANAVVPRLHATGHHLAALPLSIGGALLALLITPWLLW